MYNTELNEKQEMIYEYIKYAFRENGYPPSVREICKACNIKSTSTVFKYINELESLGYIKKESSMNRAITLLDKDNEEFPAKTTIDIPVLGRVAAGEPILASNNIEDTFPIASDFAHKGNLFMLTVKGDSMIEAGILSGDKIIVRQQETANNGEIVVALIDDSATVKRFYKKSNHIVLQPENSEMQPIILSDCHIIGIVVGLFRSY